MLRDQIIPDTLGAIPGGRRPRLPRRLQWLPEVRLEAPPPAPTAAGFDFDELPIRASAARQPQPK